MLVCFRMQRDCIAVLLIIFNIGAINGQRLILTFISTCTAKNQILYTKTNLSYRPSQNEDHFIITVFTHNSFLDFFSSVFQLDLETTPLFRQPVFRYSDGLIIKVLLYAVHSQ